MSEQIINKDEMQNEAIKKWGSFVRTKLRGNAGRFQHGKSESFVTRGNRTEGKLANSIRDKYGKHFGVIDRVTFSFERHGVFVHKGVGRGFPINSGMVIRKAEDVDSKMVHRSRHPEDWFNSEINNDLPQLADVLQEINADLIMDATKMMIK
jgi:hypothetical protein